VSRFGKAADKIVEVLGLEWAPAAGKFSNNIVEGADSSRKFSVCEALDVVRHENVMVNLSKENCSCAGGKHFVGLEFLPQKAIASVLAERHKVYESLNVAVASMEKRPQPAKRGKFLVLGPLGKFESDPDLVFIFVNPAQADRILGLASFKGAEPFAYYPASNICSTITNTLAKKQPEINFISAFERRGRRWSPNELIVALPLKDFEGVVENIPRSGFGTAHTEMPK
jgi:uncharacterized protein (DUF169 family)